MKGRPEMCSHVDFVCFPSKTEIGVSTMLLDASLFEFLYFLKISVKKSIEKGSRVHLACLEKGEGGLGIAYTRHAHAETTRWRKHALSPETAESDIVRRTMQRLHHFEFRILQLDEWQRNPAVSTTLKVYLTTDDAQENMLGTLLALYDSDTEPEEEETPQKAARPAERGHTEREELKNKLHERMNHTKGVTHALSVLARLKRKQAKSCKDKSGEH
jgi:hypothetical protein